MKNIPLLARLSRGAIGPAQVCIAVLVLSCFHQRCHAQKEDVKGGIRIQIDNGYAKLPPIVMASPATRPKIDVKTSGMTVQLYHSETGEPHGPPLRLSKSGAGRKSGIKAWTFSPDGKLIAVGGSEGDDAADSEGEVRVWEMATGNLLASSTGPDMGYVGGVAFSADGKNVVVRCLPLSGR